MKTLRLLARVGTVVDLVVWNGVLLCFVTHAWGARLDRNEPTFLDPSDLPRTTIPIERAGVERSRLTRLNPAFVASFQSGTVSTQRLWRLNLFPGSEHYVSLSRCQVISEGVYAYTGQVQGDAEGQVYWIAAGNRLAGTVHLAGLGAFQINPRAGQVYEIKELEVTQVPPCGVQGQDRPLPKPFMAESVRQEETTPRSNSAAVPAPEHEIEVMVVYTQQAMKGAFGSENLELLIKLALAETNEAFRNSDTGVQLRLVYTTQVDYSESGDLALDLARLQSTNDEIMDEVHDWRDRHQADLVCLVVESTRWYEGIASFPKGPETGFCVVERSHLTGYGLVAHEFGHNFGCDHDRDNATGGGSFGYSYGHRLEVNGALYRTLMCYLPGLPIPHFSNPDVSYRGVPTGVPETEEGPADNARTIRQMAAMIDTYRGVSIAITNPIEGTSFLEGSSIPVSADVRSMEGAIEKVEFIDSGALLAQVLNPPYEMAWTNATPGQHSLSARMTVVGGTIRISPTVLIRVRPANDDFDNRLPITETGAVVSTVLSEATSEPGEPQPFGMTENTAWWTWKAPDSGLARVAVFGTGLIRARVAVYIGDELQHLQLVAKADAPLKDVIFQTELGQMYQIMVQDGPEESSVSLQVSMLELAANDAFAKAEQVSPSSRMVRGRTYGATREPDEPSFSSGQVGHSVWFSWTPDTSGRATIALGPTSLDGTTLAVFTGQELAHLQLVANQTQASAGFQVGVPTNYWIGVDGPYQEFTLALTLVEPPPNDNFSKRISLFGSSVPFSINNNGATSEPGEPKHGTVPGGHSQWWSWRAPASGGITFTRPLYFSFTPIAPLSLAVYRGNSLSNLVQVGSHDLLYLADASFVVPVLAGTNYSIAIDGEPAGVSGQTIQLQFQSRAANDNFRQRQLIPAIPVRVSGSTLAATAEPGEPTHAGRPAQHSIWWRANFRTNRTVAVTVDCTGDSLPRLAIYAGDALTNLTSVADNDHGGTLAPTIVFPVESGNPYQIALDEDQSSFTSVVSLSYVTKPLNDDFAHRTAVSNQAREGIPGSTVGATAEPGEPDHSGSGPESQTVWYTFTARASIQTTVLVSGRRSYGVLLANSLATLPEPYVAVYTGNSLAELSLVAKGLGAANFQATNNTIYQIAVDGLDGQCGDFTLSIVQAPANDKFENAALLADPNMWISCPPSLLRSATSEPGEPNHGGAATGHSLWWTWMPQRSGIYSLTDQYFTDPYSAPVRLIEAVYTGTSLTNLTVVASNLVGGLTFNAHAGTRYYLALDLQDPRVSMATSISNPLMLYLTQQPGLSKILLRADKGVDLFISGSVGQTLALQTSSDLRNWLSIRTMTLQAADVRYRVNGVAGASYQFYRVLPGTRY